MNRTMPKRLRINQSVVYELRDALESARLTRCAVAQEHQDAMKLYLNTWVVRRIEYALEQITGQSAKDDT